MILRCLWMMPRSAASSLVVVGLLALRVHPQVLLYAERRPAGRRQLPVERPGPLPLLGRRRAWGSELGAAAGRRLHGRPAGRLATATYSKTTNSLSVAYDGNRLILNDLELQQQFPDAVRPEPEEAPRPSERATRMLERQSAYDRLTAGASVLVYKQDDVH